MALERQKCFFREMMRWQKDTQLTILFIDEMLMTIFMKNASRNKIHKVSTINLLDYISISLRLL